MNHPAFPAASLTALVASEPRDKKYPADRDHDYYACILTNLPAQTNKSFILHPGCDSGLRVLCKGTHGVNALDAVDKLLETLRADFGERVKQSFTVARASASVELSEEDWRWHLRALELGVNYHEDDNGSGSSTGATRASGVASRITPARWPPPPCVEDASISADSIVSDHASGRVPFRGSIDQEPLILEVKPPFEQRSFSEVLTIREALFGP